MTTFRFCTKEHRIRMHHQKTGGNRNAGRNTVSVSVAVLLALVMLAAGVCGGFLLTREP